MPLRQSARAISAIRLDKRRAPFCGRRLEDFRVRFDMPRPRQSCQSMKAMYRPSEILLMLKATPKVDVRFAEPVKAMI